MPQLPLALTPPRRRRFDNFVPGPNGALIDSLRHALDQRAWVHLIGPEGSGRTHLAMAAVAAWSGSGRRSLFVPGAEDGAVALLEAGSPELAVVDDIDALAGRGDAELALFNALNRWRAESAAVLLTGTGGAAFELPDLASRVGQAARLRLRRLDDDAMLRLIERLIEEFGLVARRGVVDYLGRHGPRSPRGLVALFERVSRRVHAERRVMSIPLVGEELRASAESSRSD